MMLSGCAPHKVNQPEHIGISLTRKKNDDIVLYTNFAAFRPMIPVKIEHRIIDSNEDELPILLQRYPSCAGTVLRHQIHDMNYILPWGDVL